MLEVDWGKVGTANFRVIICAAIDEVVLDSSKEKLICWSGAAFWLQALSITSKILLELI